MKCSEETRAKMSAARMGKKHSAETRAKMSAAHRGKTFSDESLARMSDAQKTRWARYRQLQAGVSPNE